MAEYIERETALREAESRIMWGASAAAVYESIRDAPAADVAPVRHGRWVHDYNNRYTCTECLNKEVMSTKHMKSFCPYCGARMDGEDQKC